MEQPYVQLSVNNAVGIIEFFHPAHNSMPSHLLSELKTAIEKADKDTTIKVIVLKSSGNRTFCAGASFNELIAIDTEVKGKLFFAGFANVINAMRKCSKIILGRVQGKAVGGGVGLASATDYCFATKYASVKLSELTIGIGPFVIEPAVERKIGFNALSQMTLDATNFFSADWAKSKGMYAQVYDTVESLDYALKAFAENLASYNPEALREMKKIFWKGTDHWDELLEERAAISGRLALSAFTKEKLKQYQ